MPQINEFSWLFMAVKLTIYMTMCMMVLNLINLHSFPNPKSIKMNFFSNIL